MIKPKITFKEKKYPGYEAFKKELKKIKGSYVSIGIHTGAGEYKDGESVIQVAFWNEFGTDKVPQRPFMRNVVYGKEGEINRLREKLMKRLIDGEITLEKALGTLGFVIAEMMRNEITGRHLRPNKDSTIAHKQREGVTPPDNPLYETGLLMRSIGFQVVIEGQKHPVKTGGKAA